MARYKEKRKNARIRISFPVGVKKELEDGSYQELSGFTLDLSEQGAGIVLPSTFDINDFINVHFDFAQHVSPLEITGKIKWKQKAADISAHESRYGIEFDTPENIASLRIILSEMTLKQIDSFLEAPLPNHMKKDFEDSCITSRANEEEIIKVVDFSPPFLKVNRFIVFDLKNDVGVRSKGLGVGNINIEDIEGHNSKEMFLAFCGKLISQGISIHLGLLCPELFSGEIKVNELLPVSIDDFILKPADSGSLFFLETTVIEQKETHLILNAKVCTHYLCLAELEELRIEFDKD